MAKLAGRWDDWADRFSADCGPGELLKNHGFAARLFRWLTEFRDAIVSRLIVAARVLGALRLLLFHADADQRTFAELFEKGPCRKYELLGDLAVGDVSDVALAQADGCRYVLKISAAAVTNRLLANEVRQLKALNKRYRNGHYAAYLPQLVETFIDTTTRRQVNIFEYRDGFYSLDEIRRQYPAGLDARHLAWIFKRMLVVLGMAHNCGLVHGAVLPPHVMVHAENHGLQLLDWTQTVPVGRSLEFVPTAYRDWYPPEVLRREGVGPATDIYLAAKCLIYVAGGDPLTARWPEHVPEPMRRFVDTCLLPAPRIRPHDAWKLHEEFDALLRTLFGSPAYHQLVMT